MALPVLNVEVGQSFYIQYAFWIWPEELGEFGNAITGFYDTESTQSILDALSAENRIASLGDIELIDFISPCEIDEYFVSENYEVRKMAFLRGSGAEDMQDTVADIILDGNHYYYAPSTVKYGGRWYLYNNMGLVANYLGANPYSWLVQIE